MALGRTRRDGAMRLRRLTDPDQSGRGNKAAAVIVALVLAGTIAGPASAHLRDPHIGDKTRHDCCDKTRHDTDRHQR